MLLSTTFRTTYGPTMLDTLLFTPTTVHRTCPPPSAVQLGFPTVVCPNRWKPVQAVPVNSFTQRALSVTPKAPHTIWFVVMTAQLPFVPITPPRKPHPNQLPVTQACPLKRLPFRLLSVPRPK